MASRWDPWRGCHRCSEGCRYCYIHKGDAKRSVDTNVIVRSDRFRRPVEKKKTGEYKMVPGLVYVCFAGDFLPEDAAMAIVEYPELYYNSERLYSGIEYMTPDQFFTSLSVH